MVRYNKQKMTRNVMKLLSEGSNNTGDARDMFLKMKMLDDLEDSKPREEDAPTTSDISEQLLVKGVVDASDISEKKLCMGSMLVPCLLVRVSPLYTMHIETSSRFITVSLNDNPVATMSIGNRCAEQVATWILRQKQNLDTYLEEWEDVLRNAAKKTKSNRMTKLAVKAIVTEAMKEFPGVEYTLVEQKRRIRIRVRLLNSRLGVFIDAWWGSYKTRLPQQLADLRTLIDTHSSTTLKDFFVQSR